MKSSKLLLAASFLLLVLCGCSGSAEITIPNSAVQSGLNLWMPVVLNDFVEKELPATVTLERTEVIARDGSDRLALKMHLNTVIHEMDPRKAIEESGIANGLKSSFRDLPPVKPPFGGRAEPSRTDESASNANVVDRVKGTVTVTFGIRYEAATAEFYCDEVRAETVEFEKLPTELKQPVKKICEQALDRYFAENSVYTLDGDDTAINVAKSSLRNVTIRDGNLVVELGVPMGS
ncbi:MAG: DUF1439 domain-containing protein [Planctomycetota bacterium]